MLERESNLTRDAAQMARNAKVRLATRMNGRHGAMGERADDSFSLRIEDDSGDLDAYFRSAAR